MRATSKSGGTYNLGGQEVIVAKCLGVEGKKGSLEPGKDADIVILKKKLKIELNMINGKVVYRREEV